MRNIIIFLFFGLVLNALKTKAENTFWWGVGNAAFQVEGSPQESDWRSWSQSSGHILDNSHADIATDFWNRYEEDFKIAKNLGAKMFRISIAWERIEPQQDQYNEEALRHYELMITCMRKYGLEPMVTLHHFVNPLWVAKKGGLTWEYFPKAFAKFTQFVVSRLSQKPFAVHWWITLNEPMVLTLASYVTGEFPPGKKNDIISAVKASGNLAVAHILSFQEIKKIQSHSMVSIAMHWRPTYAKDENSFLDRWAAKESSRFFHEQFIQSVMTGHVRISALFLLRFSQDIDIGPRPTLDFLGINYYSRIISSFHWWPPFIEQEEGPGERQEMGWEIFPHGLLESLRQAHQLTKLPLFITENGIADDRDKWRSQFISSHIEQIQLAKKEQIPVLGYLHWTLTDNFEWSKGLAPHFGLCRIKRPSLQRVCRASFQTYQEIIKKSL